MNYDGLTLAEKQTYTDFSSYLKTKKTSWVGSDQAVINPGDMIELNWSHKDSKVLGKVKEEHLTVDLTTTAPEREWIDMLKDYIFEEENRYRTQCLNLPATIIGSAQCLTGRNTYAVYEGEGDDASEMYEKQCFETILYAIHKDYVIDACRYAFENLKLNLRSAQDQEIAKYTIKNESELTTSYDTWEKNKIEKGELSMNTYDVAYNEKKAAAQKAYDEALIAAKKEKEEAAQKEANEAAAKTLKGMYDAYINAGFTPEQAEKFVTIALEKAASKVYNV